MNIYCHIALVSPMFMSIKGRLCASPISNFPCPCYVPTHLPAWPLFKRSAPGLGIAAFASEAPAATTFEHLFPILASFVSPDALVAAAATPLGRGLVPTQAVNPEATLLSVDWVNLLVVTDDPQRDGAAFGSRVLSDWQQIHGALPPALADFLAKGDATWATRLAAWLLWLRANGTGVWSLYTQLLPKVRTLPVQPLVYALYPALSQTDGNARAFLRGIVCCFSGERDDLPHELPR